MRCRVEHEYMINVEHVYQMNIIAPYRQEKWTLIHNPRIKIIKCVGALTMGTCVESLQNKQEA